MNSLTTCTTGLHPIGSPRKWVEPVVLKYTAGWGHFTLNEQFQFEGSAWQQKRLLFLCIWRTGRLPVAGGWGEQPVNEWMTVYSSWVGTGPWLDWLENGNGKAIFWDSWEHPNWAATAALAKSLGGLLLGFCLCFLVYASCVKAHSLGSARSFFFAKKSVLIQSLTPFLTDLSSLSDLSRGLLSPHRKRHPLVNHHVLWQARPGTTELRSGHGLCRSYDPLLSESRHDREGHFQ